MNLYGMEFEVQVLMVAKPEDVAKLEQSNPLGRVPALILEDGRRMIDSNAILNYLDELAGPDKRLTQADVSGVITYDYIGVLLPDLIDPDRYPSLTALSGRMNALPEIGSTYPSF